MIWIYIRQTVIVIIHIVYDLNVEKIIHIIYVIIGLQWKSLEDTRIWCVKIKLICDY